VCAIQYPGHQDRCAEELMDDIGQLADCALESLRPLLRPRPVLFGHSMGAVVAFEVAMRMERAAGYWPSRLIASGRCAPSLRRREHVHLGTDEALIGRVRDLGGTDERLLDSRDLLSTLLPALRNDFRAIDHYLALPQSRLRCPITAFVGDADPTVTIAEVTGWREHTATAFDLHVFSGGHFYVESWPTEVIAKLSDVLRFG
jgi:pyochelin biosynthesis protein PchC